MSRWDKSNWTAGKTTIFSAIGLPWKLKYPTLQAPITNAAIPVSQPLNSGGGGSNPQQQQTTPASLPGGSGGGTGGGNTTAPASTSESDWAKAVLSALGAPQSAANINSLHAWRTKESSWDSKPPDGALYTNNPLNTTLGGFHSTGVVNSVGVRIYPTAKDGVAATVATLVNGYYPGIVARLRSGQGLCGFTSQEFRTWSGNGYGSVC